MDLLIQKARILLKLSFLPWISILPITRFSLELCQLFTHSTRNLGTRVDCVTGERLGVFWTHVVFGCPTFCSLILARAPISVLDNCFYPSGCSLSSVVDQVAKERAFCSSQASQIQGLELLTKMAEGQITLCMKQSSNKLVNSLLFQDVMAVFVPNSSSLLLSCLLILWMAPFSQYIPLL